jgi:hypothetical protein
LPIPYAIEHVDIVSLLMAKNKDMEDLILLFLVIVLLVATVGMTQGREHMSKKKKEPPPMSREKSLEVVTAALEKYGRQGTLKLFDAQLQKMEDLAAKENEE